MTRKNRGGSEQQYMVVGRHQESLDANDTIAARAVLDQNWLIPAGRQAISEEAANNVCTASGTKRHDDFNRTRRPLLRGDGSRYADRNEPKGDSKPSRDPNGSHVTCPQSLSNLEVSIEPRPYIALHG